MKRVLITGAGSYIGTSFEKYIKEHYPDSYQIDTVDMIDGRWRDKSFAGYDSVFHVAGIAHSDSGRISKKKEKLYYSVNTDLTIETAEKAKADGVSQFVYMSSSIVYGYSVPIGKTKVITGDTPVSPTNCYGDSKVKAEKGISPLEDESFKIVILRPPMIYGKGCKGNYPLLSKIAMMTPIFPNIKNERSMLYIENLCEFIHLMIKNCESGTFFPQNKEHSNTSELVQLIGKAHGKKIRLISGCTPILKISGFFIKSVSKAFGNFRYEQCLSEYSMEYRLVSLEKSITATET